jgi:hypothetical protein
MLGRILAVSLQQAARSVVLTLFPASFISLFAWATAGSQSGNTTDPMRGSVWIWLGAHLVPFHLTISSNPAAGALTLLPLGALVFPIWAIRKSFPKVKETLTKVEGARFFFALSYTVIATILALISQSGGIKPLWYLVPLYTFPISYIATYDFKSAQNRFIRFAFYTLITLWGSAALILAISLAAHWSVLHDLGTVIAPGLIGGVLFLAIQVLYLPNAAFAALAYLTGIGFKLGVGTSISPTHFTLHGIPAIPLFASLPTGKHPTLILGLVVLLIFALIILIPILTERSAFKDLYRVALRTAGVTIVMVTFFGFLSSGELLTAEMNPVGVTWWHVTAYFASAFALALLIAVYLPAGVKKVARRG